MLKTSGETVDRKMSLPRDSCEKNCGAGKGVCGWYEVEEECRRIEIGRCKHCCMDEVKSLTFLPTKFLPNL